MDISVMANNKKVGIGAVVVLVIAAYLGIDLNQDNSESRAYQAQNQEKPKIEVIHKSEQVDDTQVKKNSGAFSKSSQNQHGLEVIRHSYDRKISNVQVQSEGRVKAILRDDNDGSRHQKFILSLDNGLTVLVAHNIDLAPKIENLNKGDIVEFFGEYEYSRQGGVMHWTHHDPRGRHVDGWLKHKGKKYK